MTLRIDTNNFYTRGGTLFDRFTEETHKFEPSVKAALAQIRSTEVGSGLIKAIESAGQEVLIVRPAPNVGANKCAQSDKGQQACDAACYQEVLKVELMDKKIKQLQAERKVADDHPAVKKYNKFYIPKARGGEHEDYVKTLNWQGKQDVPVPLAHKQSQDEVRNAVHTTDETVRARFQEGSKPQKIAEAVGYVQALQCGLIGYHIMDHLTPGSGTGAWVVWEPLLESVGTDLPAEKRAAWMDRPPWIALAHELIHGWRLVTGRCVFKPGPIEEYYEEAMTVGLPPYDQCRFTENRLRHLNGLPLRTFYGESNLSVSNRAAAKHGSATSRFKLSIKIVGSGPADPLVFDYEIRSAGKPNEIVSGKTDDQGNATAQSSSDGEIRFRGFGAFGRVETQWQKILINRYMTLQFGRYRFICDPV